jgi:hypothetical protein
MPQETLYERIHRQFLTLVEIFPGRERRIEFLEERPIPGKVGPLLPCARAVAEMLKAAPTVQMVTEELRADPDKTRCFYQFAMSQLQTLREHDAGKTILATEAGKPFEELASWVLALIDRRP